MADEKISELTEVTAVAGTDILPVVESSTTKKLQVDNLFTDRRAISSMPLATVGVASKLTADGTFDTDSGWTLGAGWAIAGGKATHTAGSVATLVGTTTMGNSKVHKFSIVLSGVSNGSISVNLGGYELGLTLNADGTHNCWGICGDDTAFTIIPTTDFDGSIETITGPLEITRSIPEFKLYLTASGSGYDQPVELRTGNGHDNLGIGFQALSCVQPDYTFVGAKDSEGPAGPYRGNSNVGIGDRVLASVTTGKYNNAIGQESLLCCTTGYNNVAIGDSCMNNLTSGYNNTGLGYEVLGRIINGYENTVIGSNAAYDLTSAIRNTLLGSSAGANITTANSNVAVGYGSLFTNISGSNSVAIGYGALYNTTVGGNMAIGYYALYDLTTGSSMTALGYNAGRKIAENTPLTDTTGVLIGYNTGRTVISATQLTNYIGIGYNVEVSASNQTVIGNSSNTETYLGSVSGASKLICSKAKFTAIPTGTGGLSTGDIWSDGGTLKIVS